MTARDSFALALIYLVLFGLLTFFSQAKHIHTCHQDVMTPSSFPRLPVFIELNHAR